MSRPHYAGTEIAQRISIADDIDVTDINIQPEHQAAIRETEDHNKKQKTINDLCNCLQNMVDWVQVQNPEHYSRACIHLTQEQLADKKQYHKQKNRFHLLQNKCKNYSGIYLCT